MKKLYLLISLVSIITNALAQENNDILSEINTIENSLIKNIQIEGDSVQKFNIHDRMDFYKVPGVSIAVVQNGKIKWAKGYGYANTKTGAKVDINTLFQAGSISKPIAALAALKLSENNSLELNKDVNNYLKNDLNLVHSHLLKEKICFNQKINQKNQKITKITNMFSIVIVFSNAGLDILYTD